MSKLDDVALSAAQDTMQALLKRFEAVGIHNARIKQEWIKLYMICAGQQWEGPKITYEEAVHAWDALHGESGAITWQPIDTAPKDGSVILVVHKRGSWIYPKDPRRINCVVVYWSGGKFREFGPDDFREDELTHWTPIPEPA